MGTVRDTVTKAPLPGVAVEANDAESARTTISGADGGFRFDRLAPATYRLKYTLPGYLGSDAKGTQTISIKAGAVTEHITLELTPFARIEGTVFDEDGQPLAGVNIHTSGIQVPTAALRATTSQDGRYAITQLEPGPYRIEVRIPDETRRRLLKRNPETGETFGYASPEYYPGTADPQAALPVTVSGGLELRGFDIRLRRTRVVEIGGRAVESSGEPLAGARVELWGGPERRVADDGSFRFDLIQPGFYRLLVYRGADKNALPYLLPVEVGKAGIQDFKVVVPASPTIPGSVLAPPQTDWAGQVVVSVLSAPLPFARREFNFTSEKFTIDELPPGRWMVQVDSKAVKRSTSEKLFIKSARFGTQNAMGETITITESGNPPLEIQLTAERGRVSGMAFNADGLPLRRAMILCRRAGAGVFSAPQMALSAEDGSFAIEDLGPGTYRLRVAGGGPVTSPSDDVLAEVKPGETATVRLTAPKP